MSPPLKDLLDVAIEAAYAAGKRTLAYFNTRVAVETKSDDTPVTIADREAEQLIRDHILRSFPTHSILGEEGGIHVGDDNYRWIIDPIDGTKSFICGVPMYGVLIGVLVGGRPQVGVVHLPATDEMISAATGLGCTSNGRVARVSETKDLSQAVVCCTSITSAIARSDVFDTIAAKAKVIRGWGDCYGHVLVATGRADVMLDPRMNPWDCAPLPPIMTEAGGHYTTWTGAPDIFGPDGVSTNAALHAQVLDVLRNEHLKPSWSGKSI